MLKYIEDLLQGAEVEWKPLGEVFELRNGYTPSKSNQEFWKNGTIPWFRMEDLRASKGILHDSIQHVSAQAIKGKGLFPKDSILLATTATIGEHALLATDALANQRFTNFAICEKFKTKLIPKFVYYYFFVIDEWCKQNITMGNFPSVNIAQLKKQSLPLPPLSVQAEIVRILDKFTSLEAELEAELDCRKRQYEHYRNQLLSFENTTGGGVNNVIWKPLGEVGEFVRGNGLQKKDFTNEGVPAIHYGQIYTYYGTSTEKTISFVSPKFAEKARKASPGSLIIATTSENEEDVCKAVVWLGDTEVAVSNDACFFEHNLCPKYMAYFFQTEMFQQQKRTFITGAKVKRVNAKDLSKILIPLPPLSEQERIVGILDRFEALAHSMSEGLPREIALRRQQYEHYRRELLDFARPQS